MSRLDDLEDRRAGLNAEIQVIEYELQNLEDDLAEVEDEIDAIEREEEEKRGS